MLSSRYCPAQKQRRQRELYWINDRVYYSRDKKNVK